LENTSFSSNFAPWQSGQWSMIVIFILQKYNLSSWLPFFYNSILFTSPPDFAEKSYFMFIETQHIEFKSSFNEEVIETLVAFCKRWKRLQCTFGAI
jgi:hypothetical protein